MSEHEDDRLRMVSKNAMARGEAARKRRAFFFVMGLLTLVYALGAFTMWLVYNINVTVQ